MGEIERYLGFYRCFSDIILRYSLIFSAVPDLKVPINQGVTDKPVRNRENNTLRNIITF